MFGCFFHRDMKTSQEFIFGHAQAKIVQKYAGLNAQPEMKS